MREMSFYASLVYFALLLVFGVGYLTNLGAVFNAHGNEIVLRVVGVVIPPIGVILGYLM
jgi:hypothetical protein